MFKHVARNLTLALTFAALATPAIHAQATTPPTVTGGDPEPTSPHGTVTPGIVEMVLIALHLA
jgi:hypothetical protein